MLLIIEERDIPLLTAAETLNSDRAGSLLKLAKMTAKQNGHYKLASVSRHKTVALPFFSSSSLHYGQLLFFFFGLF